MKSRLARVALILALATYIVLTLHYGRFQADDEVFFKSAGREWAAHGKFAAPELRGFRNLDPPVEAVWFAYMPLYTFLFGVFVRMFGFDVMQVTLFDVLIHVALCLSVYALARALTPEASPARAVVAAGLAIPLATIGR